MPTRRSSRPPTRTSTAPSRRCGTRAVCRQAGGGAWFRVGVTNTGHRSGYLTGCVVLGFDRGGRRIYIDNLFVHPFLIGGINLGPGRTYRWTWFVDRSPPTEVHRFGAECDPVDYHGNPPI